MTLHKLSAGDGYRYYTREVACADELRQNGRQLGDYYTVDGNPPGQWGGRGAVLLGVSGDVSEAQMAALYGEGLHPNAEAMIEAGASVSDTRLGQRYRQYNQKDLELSKRIDRGIGDFERMNQRKPDAEVRRLIRVREGAQYFREVNGRNATDKEELGRFITAQTKPAAQAVAGYDLVFAPAKSASVLWAIGGEEARKGIEAAHYEAIEETMAWLEDEAIFTRRGRNGVRQEDVEGGLVYTRFRHYDSRTGDPQLHDHVVVANRVKGVDGKWGTIDGDVLYRYNVTASERYNRLVMEKICKRLGVGLIERKVKGDQPIMEIAGVDVAAIDAASSRRAGITGKLDELVAGFTEDHGYAPNKKQLIQLAQQATLETRPEKKSARQLRQLVQEWEQEFARIPGVVVGEAALTKARAHRDDRYHQMLQERSDWLVTSADELDAGAEALAVIESLEKRRSVWGEHHIDAEIRRRLGSRFGEQPIPEDFFEQVKVRAIDQQSLRITPEVRQPELEALRLRNGRSRYGRQHRILYTSAGILAAEDRLLTAAQRHVIPAATQENFERALTKQERQLDAGQLALAREFSCGDRLLTVGVGPAGTGKTTALKLAADTIRESGGRVFGLAPTAVAAAVMGKEIGATANTIDLFVLAHQNGTADEKMTPQPGDMIVIDEAGMVSTPLFAAAVTIAERQGALIRALGDDQQLSSVGSGGALRLLKNEVGAVHLEDLHRFRNADGTVNEAEAAATIALREAPAAGRIDDPWTFYRENQRAVGGDVEAMTNEVFTAWQKDTNEGLNSIMMAFDNATVTELNARAQAYRIGTGELAPGGPTAQLRDGLLAREGDILVTRDNNRRLTLNQGKDFVKNNDVWTVTGIHDDGGVTVKHRDHGGVVDLPASYVAQHSMLGYAHTIHRTQGVTSDTTHSLISGGLTRALAYVAASRGKYSNKIYGALEEGESLDSMLAKVAANHDGNLTAHEEMVAARAEARSAATMVEVLTDIEDQANEHRAATMARRVLGDGVAEPFIRTTAWGAVATHLRAAARDGFNDEALLKDAVVEADFGASEDHGAVLAWRIEQRLARWRRDASAGVERPLENLSTEHLERLQRRAIGDLMRARVDANRQDVDVDRRQVMRDWLKQRPETPWQRRLHGDLTDEKLAERIRKAEQALRTDTVINDPEAMSKARWLNASLHREAARREQMPAAQREDEAFERGASSRSRIAGALVSRLNTELELRRRQTTTTPSRIPDRVPEWMMRSDVATSHDTPAPWRQELLERRELLDAELARRGAELSAQQPLWATELGPVPGSPRRAETWRTLAAEIDAFRTKYKIPAEESAAIPARFRDKGVGAELQAQITAAHKYGAQTKIGHLGPNVNALVVEAAEVHAVITEDQTPAERVVDELQAARGQDAALSPAQERAERIAALARKLRRDRAGTEQDENDSASAVQEALNRIKARKAAEQEELERHRSDETRPKQDRGSGIGL